MQSVVVVVKSLEGSHALVEAVDAGCGRCHETGGCGGKNLSRAFCGSPKQFRIPNKLDLHAGDRVRVGTSGDSVRAAASRAYLMPLLLLIGGAGIGGFLNSTFSVLGALIGLVGGWVLLIREKTSQSPPEMLEQVKDA